MIKSPVKAIRAKCLDCCCGSPAEVNRCHLDDCALHPFRFGKNPFIKREMTDEQKKVAGDRLKEINKKRLAASGGVSEKPVGLMEKRDD